MARDGEFKKQIEGVVARTDAALREREPAPAGDLFGEMLAPAGADVASSLPQPRGAHRPAGALGKRSKSLARYFAAKGYRDPAAGLGELASSDPLDLLAWFRQHDEANAPSLIEVVRLQAAVRRDLLPYLHAKVPPKIDKGERLAVMILSGSTEPSDDEAADEALTIEGDWEEVD